MTVTLYPCTAERIQIDKSAALGTGVSYITVVLKEPTDIMNPVILIQSSTNLSAYNYLYMVDWGRYYFINNITYVRNELYQLDCHIDVLFTYKTQIGGLSAVISRQESSYNDMIPDQRRIALPSKAISEVSAADNLFTLIADSSQAVNYNVVLTTVEVG